MRDVSQIISAAAESTGGPQFGTCRGTSGAHRDRVLSIAKLRVGQEAYQLSGVASSLDDYYTGRGEADGRWLGAGADRLGLAGAVAADDLRAVLAGLAPGTGGLTPDGTTVRTHVRRVPGFDLTFKVPKSVSVLYAVSDDPRVQGAIIEAGEAALAASLGWLEREAAWVRRGSGDTRYLNDLAARDPAAAAAVRQRPVKARGLVAASFRHRTSRAGDPLLHWHTLLANIAEGPDGRWGAVIHPELYRHARAAGELFQTVLRAELTERLGLEWRPGVHVPEVAGVPQQLCEQFSKRSAEVAAWLAATGTPDDAAGRQAAVLATRRGKPELEGERFDQAWKTEAAAAGWGPDAAEALVMSCDERAAAGIDEVWRIPTIDSTSGAVVDQVIDPEEWIAMLGRELTARDSTFTRPDLFRAVATRIGEGATAATIECIVARVLGSDHVVPIADDGVQRWTTVELLGVEARFLDAARSTRNSRLALADRQVRRVLAGVSLSEEQAAAAAVLAASRDAVSVLVGAAGTGKTHTLNVVRQVFETTGCRVVGAAPSARAAHELETDALIGSSTIHRLLGSWERGDDLPDARTVLVIDEAGMAAIRDLERAVAPVVAAGGRVLLVGDHHQLPEVAAGGGFAALAADPAATVAQLTENRRQQHQWEIDALAQLRNGHVAHAIAAYRDHDRVIATETRPELVTAGVQRWLDAHRAGSVPILLAGTNEMVNALNTAARQRLLHDGVLGPIIENTSGALAIGERLMIRSNDYHAATLAGQQAAVLNGQPCTLTAPHDDGYVVRMDHDATDIVLTRDFVHAGGVDYAYASTAHKAQGGTWDLSITVGLDGLFREAGYLVMSRGRQSNWLVVTQPELDELDAELGSHRHPDSIPLPSEEPDTLDEELLSTLSVSRRKLLAHTRDPHAPAIQHLATTLDYTTIERWAAYAEAVEHQATRIVGIDPYRARGRLSRLEHTAHHAAVGYRVKAWDRRNIGTIVGIDDAAGTVQVRFVAVNGRIAVRRMGWADVTIIDPRQPEQRILTEAAHSTLERLAGNSREQLARWDAHLAQHGVQPDDRHIYTSAAALGVDRAAAHLTAAEPDWLTTLIGPRPLLRPAATQMWDDAVRDLATHRLRNDVTDPATPTGPDIADPADVWTAAAPALTRARLWLDTHTELPATSTVRTCSTRELQHRRHQLDNIFAAAPPDVRRLIDELQTATALPLGDTTQLLNDALATHGERRQWILQHWPHVVEAAEIDSILRHHQAGTDPDPIIAALANSDHPLLAAAATGETWLTTLASQLVAPDNTSLPSEVERLLADVADYRDRWQIADSDPLGSAAVDIDQADQRHILTLAINHAAASAVDATDLLAHGFTSPRGGTLLDDVAIQSDVAIQWVSPHPAE